MTKITSAIAASLIASASFGTAALAEGNYYEGAAPVANQQAQQQSVSHSTVRYGYAGSVAQSEDRVAAVNSGDYYDGAHRPN